ncbi:unnamed protein product [Rotaria sp. Silwood1]|nr:unnamed protein product [Rotaria sp. Silwood1]
MIYIALYFSPKINFLCRNVYSIDKSSKNISDSVFVEVMAIGDLIKSTLGRKEKDKILQGNINGKLDVDKLPVTDDETAILSKISIHNPVAKVFIGMFF